MLQVLRLLHHYQYHHHLSNVLKVCNECGATWIDGQLYWRESGKEACPHDLAGLVCNEIKDPDCINPCLGSTSGVTWLHYQNELERYKDDE